MNENWTTEQIEERNIRQADQFFGQALEQLSAIAGALNSAVAATKPTRKPRTHPERDLEKACSDLLQLDGWRMLKTDPCSDRRRGKGFGEIGMADCLYIRYNSGVMPQAKPQDAQVLWIEWKSSGGGPTSQQRLWIAAERARRALVLLAGADFPCSVEGFLGWYRESGLMRRKL